MSLKLRRIIWDDGKPSRDREDYIFIDERDEKIGRMYRAIRCRRRLCVCQSQPVRHRQRHG